LPGEKHSGPEEPSGRSRSASRGRPVRTRVLPFPVAPSARLLQVPSSPRGGSETLFLTFRLRRRLGALGFEPPRLRRRLRGWPPSSPVLAPGFEPLGSVRGLGLWPPRPVLPLRCWSLQLRATPRGV